MKRVLTAMALLSASQQADAADIELARSYLNVGVRALDSAEYPAAIKACKAGIKAIGNHYGGSNIIDDTGQKLVVAETNEKQNRPDIAASVYCSVLKSRLSVLK